MNNEEKNDQMDDVKEKIKKAEDQITEKKPIILESKKKKRKMKFLFLEILLIIFIASCLYNYFETKKIHGPAHASFKEQIEDINIHLYLVYSKIEQYKEEFGSYPWSLNDDIEDENLEYILHPDNSYILKYKLHDTVLTYNSTEEPDRLLSQGFFKMVEPKEAKK